MYSEFAEIYDRLQDIDYNSFVQYYVMIFEKLGLKPSLVLDLGCGTGNITIPMSKLGYDMIGVDISAEMLDIASQKARENSCDILFLNQDMTEFELYGTVDAAVCALDGVNYITEDGGIDRLFSLIHNYLNPGGVFIFDINTPHKLKDILADNTFVYDEDGAFLVWSSELCTDNICEFYLDFFIENSDGLYRRGCEVQTERIYTDSEIRFCAERAGLSVIAAYDDRSEKPAAPDSERIFYIFKK